MSYLASVGLRTKLLGAFGAVLVVLVLLASAAYRTTALNQAASDRVSHTFEVIASANAAFAHLVDMETSYRGFLLTGDEAFLTPYTAGDAAVDTEIERLLDLTQDNPIQVERWRSLSAQVDAWRRIVTEPGIALRHGVTAGTATQDDLTRYVATGEGRRRFSAMRMIYSAALDTERALLAERQVEASDRRVQLEILLVVGTVVAVGLGVAMAFVLAADLAGPVSRLATTARQIADGQLDRRIGLQRGDEVGQAAASFDRMADQLQATIQQSDAILDTAAEAILGLDRSGRVTFANPTAVRMLGSPASALVGQPASPWIVIVASDRPQDAGANRPAVTRSLTPIEDVLARGVGEDGMGDLIRPADGSRVPIELACAPIEGSDGETLGAVLTFRDITERLASQRALEEHARELARSNADLEQFAYVASHDLQEPLRAVVSYLQLLERRYSGQLDERAEKYIGYAVDGGRRMQTLITDLLTYSRVGRRDIAMARVELDALVERVLAGLRVAIEESGAEITRDPLPAVVADASQMTQLFQNLLGNAIKFRGDAPPRIHISVEHRESATAGSDTGTIAAESSAATGSASAVAVRPEGGRGAWLFAVRDNGIGIAPEYRERVFVLFQRLHGRDEYSGTGIGLAVCKRIVERHGGTLWVDDTPGGGSTFWFTIPDPGDTPT